MEEIQQLKLDNTRLVEVAKDAANANGNGANGNGANGNGANGSGSNGSGSNGNGSGSNGSAVDVDVDSFQLFRELMDGFAQEKEEWSRQTRLDKQLLANATRDLLYLTQQVHTPLSHVYLTNMISYIYQ